MISSGSQFPGMVPYLEKRWGDVHISLIALEQLRRRLPEGLVARIEQRVFVESEESPRTFVPDVYVVKGFSRAGTQDLLLPQRMTPPRCRALYQACVWRAAIPAKVELYAFGLKGPSPGHSYPVTLRRRRRRSGSSGFNRQVL